MNSEYNHILQRFGVQKLLEIKDYVKEFGLVRALEAFPEVNRANDISWLSKIEDVVAKLSGLTDSTKSTYNVSKRAKAAANRESHLSVEQFDQLVADMNESMFGRDTEVIDSADPRFIEVSKGFDNSDFDKYKSFAVLPAYIEKSLTRHVAGSIEDIKKQATVDAFISDKSYASLFSAKFATMQKFAEEGHGIDKRWKELITSELSKAQIIEGSNAWFTHNVESSLSTYPEGFDAFKVSEPIFEKFVDRLGQSDPNSYYSKHCSIPRTTSPGLWMKVPGKTEAQNIFVKGLEAMLAIKAPSFSALLERLEQSFKIIDPTGVVKANCYELHTRAHHARKWTAIFDPSKSGELVQIAHKYALGWYKRLRTIACPCTVIVAEIKPFANAMMKCLFDKVPIFDVSPDNISKQLNQIDNMSYNEDTKFFEDEGGYIVCADLSAMDRTVHGKLYELINRVFKHTLGKSGYSDVHSQYQKEAAMLSATDPYAKAKVMMMKYRYDMNPSGCPRVTSDNNLAHGLAIPHVIEQIAGLDIALEWMERQMFSKSSCRSCLHGDDSLLYLPHSVPWPDFVKTMKETIGWDVEQEPGVSYLKKLPAMAYGLSDGKIYGNVGSLTRNRTGEYTNNNKFVFAAGCHDTISHLPSNNPLTDLYKGICEATLSTLFNLNLKQVSNMVDNGDLNKGLEVYAKESIVKAKQVQQLLDRLYYSNGQVIPSSYGSLFQDFHIDTDDLPLNRKVADMTFEELADLCDEIQLDLIASNGDSNVMNKYLAKYAA